jgi:hypothetical protein
MKADGQLVELWGLQDDPTAAEKRLFASVQQQLRASLGLWGLLISKRRLRKATRDALFSVCYFQMRACLHTEHKRDEIEGGKS